MSAARRLTRRSKPACQAAASSSSSDGSTSSAGSQKTPSTRTVRRGAGREHVDAELAQARGERRADAAAVRGDDHPAARAEHDARWARTARAAAGAPAPAPAAGTRGRPAYGAGASVGCVAASVVRRGGCVGAVFDEADDVAQGGVVAQAEVVVAGDAVALADGGEHLGLFDGVDAEVGFEVEVGVEHVGGVAGLGGDDLQDRGGDVLAAARARVRVRARRRGRRSVRVAVRCGGAVFDEADDVAQGGVVAQAEVVVAGDAVALADGGEHLGLFDGVDAEVGFEVEVGVEHVGGVAGLGGDDLQDRGGDVRQPRGRGVRRSGSGGVGAVGSGGGAVRRAVRSSTKPTTWRRVG